MNLVDRKPVFYQLSPPCLCQVRHFIKKFKFVFQIFQEHNEPLFSSHMLDLSEEFDEENIATCVKYFKRMAPMKMWLEMEIGITGGEEDGVDNSNVKADALYTKPEQVSKHS